MAHDAQLHFMEVARANLPEHFTGTRVLEVGSLDVNGAIRGLFHASEYVGIDVGPGPGVDLVVRGEDFQGPDASFDVVVSCECMEHNPEWAATTTNMVRMLKPEGLLLLTCAAPGRPEHGTPMTDPGSSPLTAATGQDYYRNLTPRDFHRVLRGTDGLTSTASWVNWESHDLYLAGFKGEQPRGWDRFVDAVGEYDRAVRRPADLLRSASLAAGGQAGYAIGERLIGLAYRCAPRRRAEATR